MVLHAQNKEYNNSLDELLNILSKSTNTNDLIHRKDSILASTKLRDIESVEIIASVLQANILAKENNCINKKSSNLYNNAVTLAKKMNNKSLVQWVCTQQGYYYYLYREYIKAWPLFLESSRLLNNASEMLVFQPTDTYIKNAAFFTLIQDYKQSNHYLQKGIKVSTGNTSKILNNIGFNYLKQGITDSSLMSFNKAKVASLKEKNNKQFITSLHNIATLQATSTNWKAAEKTLLQIIEISKANNYTEDLFKAHLKLGKVYLSLKDFTLAKNHISIAEHFRKNNSSCITDDLALTEVLVKIASYQNDYSNELRLRKKIDSLKTITKVQDHDNVIKTIIIENEKNKISGKLQNTKQLLERESLTKWILLCILIFLLLILFVVIYFNNRKLKLQQKQFQSSLAVYKANKVKSDSKLKAAQLSLKLVTDDLDKKNTQILHLEKEIKKLTKRNLPSKHEKKIEFEELLSSHLMTNENWLQFKNIFIEEESMYFNELNTKYPDLTESNLRIIILTKIGLNNQEIAKVLGITIDAVKKSKQRLRQKYGQAVIPF